MSMDDLHRLRYDLDDLDHEIRGFAGLKTELAEFQGSITESVDALRHELSSEIEDAQETADDAVGRVDELRAILDRLARRIDWLERNIRQAEGAEPFDLDARDLAIESAVRSILRRRELQADLLTDAQRHQLTATSSGFKQTLARWEALQSDVLTASRTLATTPPSSEDHQQAAVDFRLVLQQEQESRKFVDKQAERARTARTVLADDDRLLAVHGPALDEGVKAEHTLHIRLRTRVSAALADGSLLPVWFTTAFGALPPREGTAAWLDTATRTLAYRLTYGVTDPVVALGRHVPEDELGAQYALFTGLQREIAKLSR